MKRREFLKGGLAMVFGALLAPKKLIQVQLEPLEEEWIGEDDFNVELVEQLEREYTGIDPEDPVGDMTSVVIGSITGSAWSCEEDFQTFMRSLPDFELIFKYEEVVNV